MELFQNDRYITRGIHENVNPLHYIALFGLIDSMEIDEKDYLQIFEIKNKFNKRKFIQIEHTQEQPPYKETHKISTVIPINNVIIYVIDDGDHTVMMLSEEY